MSSDGSGRPAGPGPRPTGRRRFVSIRLIVTGASVGLMAVSVLGVGWLAVRDAREALTHEIQARLLLESRHLARVATDVLGQESPEQSLGPLLAEMIRTEPELALVVVLDQDGNVRGHPQAALVGLRYTPLTRLVPAPSRQRLNWGEAFLVDGDILVASVPVVASDKKRLGRVLIGITRSHVDGILAESRWNILVFTGLFLLAGIATTLLLMNKLLRPVAVLREGLERIGRGDLNTPVDLKNRTEFGLLAETMNRMSGGLKEAQREMAEKERLDHEMQLARKIQRSLLPPRRISFGDFVVDGFNRPAAEVGGDYFDILRLPDGRILMAIADVAGKGLGGCLITSMLAALFHSRRLDHDSPSVVLASFEQVLCEFLPPGSFLTMFYGVLDPWSGRLRYASAAHLPLLVYSASERRVTWHETRGIPIGAVRGGALMESLEDKEVILQPGDLAVQFTDGFSEAPNAETQEEYDFGRIEETVRNNARTGCQGVMEALETSVLTWSGKEAPADDQTLLVISRELPVVSRSFEIQSDGSPDLSEIRSLDWLVDKLRGRPHIRLKADLSQLRRLSGWVGECPEMVPLGDADRSLVEAALYELCGNIIEHGCAGKPDEWVDIWWISGSAEAQVGISNMRAFADYVRAGYFLICDRGVPYDHSQAAWGDLDDTAVRVRGRGFGLQIIQQAVESIRCQSGTPAGNITIMQYDPAKHWAKEATTDE